MPLQKLTFKPGVNRENTRYTNEGGWWDMDKIRFRSGTPEKIGGWQLLGAGTFLGVARFLHNWATIARENLLAIGTNLKIYLERGQTFYDITPIRYTVVLTNPFTTGTAGSTTVTVTAVAHGAAIDDFVTFTGATAVDGILATTLNTEHQITSVTANTFTFIATPCTLGAVTGGGTVTAAFQVNTGPTLSVAGVGVGVGAFGAAGWGLAAASNPGVVTAGMRQWVGDNFGQDFIFSIRDGGIYYWSASGGSIDAMLSTRAVAIQTIAGASDAPTVADNLLVTDDQHVLAIGTNPLGSTVEDPMLIRWCDQGNPLNWTPSAASTAGDQRITAGSYTYAAKKVRQENLIWTDTTLITVQFVGPPIVFSFNTLAENISVASVTAVAVADNVAYWMGKDKFYVYNGQVQTLNSTVRKYVFSNMNMSQIGQVQAGTNVQYNEVIWFYCSLNSTVIDRYVVYNYVEDIWTFGSMSRSAWLDSPLRPNPLAAGYDGKVYYHDLGMDDGSTVPPSPIDAFLESADFDIGDGQNYSFVQRIIPDVDFDGSTAQQPTVTLTLKARSAPGAAFTQTDAKNTVQTSVVPFGQFTEQAWTRIRGRQMSFRIESNQVGTTWQLGTPRIDIREDGQR